MDKIKTYRPIHVNMESDLLMRLDRFKGVGKYRSELIHEAVHMYVDQLEKRGVKPKKWFSS